MTTKAEPVGIDTGQGNSSAPFMLFSGAESEERPRTVSTFATEAEARRALARRCGSATSRREWTELVFAGSGRPSVLAWSGRPFPHFTLDKLDSWSTGIDAASASEGSTTGE